MEQEDKKDVALRAEEILSGSDAKDVSFDDKFNGWWPVEFETKKRSWRTGFMQVAAGFLLATGVSVSYYFWCQKQGRKVIPIPPVLTQTLSQASSEALSQEHEREREHSNHLDTSNELASKEREVDIDKDLEESSWAEDEKDMHSEDQENTQKREEQHSSGENKQHMPDGSAEGTQYKITEPAGKPSKSPHDPEFAASQPAAEPATAQLHRKGVSSERTEEPQVSSLQPAAKARSSGHDTKKASHGIRDELQVVAPQPTEKSRSSRRSRKKTSANQGTQGKVIVPAVVDRMQEQALTVLQDLKVLEEGSDPRAICRRRDYARWLIATSSTLTKSSANKVYTAMYIEDVTELAFADVTPDDPDFIYIQGLAEAGLIPSNFSYGDGELGECPSESDSDGVMFRPDSPVSRQDLVSWKVALGRQAPSAIDKEAFEAKSGFLDIDRIEGSVRPALVADLEAGDNSIITSAFGFTRRFQPDKAATIGQAAIALAFGETSDRFLEELARLQAEKMAEEAVAADVSMQAQTQKELDSLFNGQLSAERQQKEQAEKLFEEVKDELEKLKAEREAEKDVLLKDKTTVETEKELLHQLKTQVDERLQALSKKELQLSIEQEKLEQLRFQAEEDKEVLSILKSEAEVQKQALAQARLWAADEARKAQAEAQALEKTRRRRAGRGNVNVVETFDEDDVSGTSWANRSIKARTELEKIFQRVPLDDVMEKGEELKYKASDAAIQSWRVILRVLNACLQRIMEFLHEIRWRTQYFYRVASSSTGHVLQDSASVVSQKLQDIQTTVAELSTGVVDGTKKFVDECRGEVKKFGQRFKHD